MDHRIREIRKGVGVSQEQLAHMVNLTRQTISNFERGVSSPSLLDMKRISQALRVPLPDLLSPELIKPSVAA